jgi:hypothetical protein
MKRKVIHLPKEFLAIPERRKTDQGEEFGVGKTMECCGGAAPERDAFA